ncbi:MAG: type II and III secretion system protein [Treponema sp.]|nr:type II and III secretion system protein [Treponema sp.]
MPKIIKYLIPLLITAGSAHAQKIKSMEFSFQKKTDILMVFAGEMGVSVIPDQSISGTTSFHFENLTAREAFEEFLAAEELYAEEKNSVIHVSAVYVSKNPSTQKLTVYGKNVLTEDFIKRISSAEEKTIVFDPLPEERITLNIKEESISTVLEICTLRLEGFTLEEEESYFYIKKSGENRSSKKSKLISRNEELYSCCIDGELLNDVLEQFFSLSDTGRSVLTPDTLRVPCLHARDKTFTQMLSLITENAGCSFSKKDGIWFIFEDSRKSGNIHCRETETFSLHHSTAQEILKILPSDLISHLSVKPGKNSSTLTAYGTETELKLLKDALKKTDIPDLSTVKIISIKNTQAEKILPLLPRNLFSTEPLLIAEQNAIMITEKEENLEPIYSCIEALDRAKPAEEVKLKYIKTEDLFSKLPPSVEAGWIKDSGYPNLIFYTGPEEKKEIFLKELSAVDRPRPQIRYQMLAVQYNGGKGTSVKKTASVKRLDADKCSSFTGELSNITSLAFNVIDSFGWQFAASLNSQISENRARIFTDTTLTSISGEEVRFQNTDTYRYLEYEYETASGITAATGVTQQITSGLIVSIKGWVSGDSMITMDVNATISKQNSDSSSQIPSTSERVVNSHIRTKSGKSIVISGLIKEDENDNKSRTPFLSRIPVIGKLFEQNVSSKEKTEIEIYIIPVLVTDENEERKTAAGLYEYLMET